MYKEIKALNSGITVTIACYSDFLVLRKREPIMDVQVKSCDGITLMPIETKLLSDRKIFLEGEIDSESACEFVKKLLYLCLEDSEQPIDIMINSVGGGIQSGLFIYDILQSCRTPLRMFCMGTAFSMAAVIFTSGKTRYMFPNSELMLHEPLISNGLGGSASSVRSVSDSLLESKDKINRILSKHTGKTPEEIEEATRFDHYFSPEEAIRFGLADEIIGFEKMLEV